MQQFNLRRGARQIERRTQRILQVAEASLSLEEQELQIVALERGLRSQAADGPSQRRHAKGRRLGNGCLARCARRFGKFRSKQWEAVGGGQAQSVQIVSPKAKACIPSIGGPKIYKCIWS